MKKILFLFIAAFVCALGANAEVWKKVTSAPADWSGKYLIACDNGEDWTVLDGSRSGDPNDGNLQSTMNFKVYDVNADGDIVLDGCDYYVTIAPFGTGYSICTASGWYLGRKDDTNGLNPSAEPMLNTITLDAEQGVLITAQGGSVLRYNASSGQDRFRYYKSSNYTYQQKIALYKLEEAAPVDPVVPAIDGYEALSTPDQISAGTYLLLNRFGWGVGAFTGTKFSPLHVESMDTGDNNVHNTVWIYDGEVNGDNLPSEFEFEPTSGGKFYMKDVVTGKYVNGTTGLSESATPSTEWYVTLTDAEHRYFEVSYDYNNSTYSLQYDGYNSAWWPYYGARTGAGQPMRIYRKGGAGNGDTPVEPATKWEGEITLNKTSISSVEDLEGLQITFVGAQQVEFNEYGMYMVCNEDGRELYALWAQYPEEGYNGTYTLEGNTVTLGGFSTIECDPIPAGTTAVYLMDYYAFLCNGETVDDDVVTSFEDYAIAFNGAPVAQPFELKIRNNNIYCANGAKVEAAEYGVASDFYLENSGITAVGQTATLYKDGTAMTFAMTWVDETAISFFGGSSQLTEPGTYLLEVPAGTYVDAAGNPNAAYYGQWVIIQKEPTYVEPVLKAEDVSAEVAYYIYTTARGGLTVQNANATQLVGTSEAGVYQTVDPTDVRQQFAFVNWEGKLYLYSVATQKFIGKANRGNFTDEPVDPIYFKNASNGTVMLYFDDNFNINLGGSKQVTIDTWKTKDAGNSFIIKVAEPFDQSEIFERLNPKAWDRDLTNIGWSEANTLDDLLNVTVEFPGAASVEASGYDVLGVVFDSKGLPYAVALGNGTFDSFGAVTFNKSKANVKFQKIADLNASSQEAVKVALKKIGGFQPAAGEACVVFSAKSFVVDGILLDEIVAKNYVLVGEGTVTGINGINVDANAQIFDLQGRRVNNATRGMYIVNGVKVVK